MRGGRGRAYCCANTLWNAVYKKGHPYDPNGRWMAGKRSRMFTVEDPQIQIRHRNMGRLCWGSDRGARQSVPPDMSRADFQAETAGLHVVPAYGYRADSFRRLPIRPHNHPDTVPIMIPAVGPDGFLGPCRLNSPVGGNHIMISASVPAAGTMQAVEILTPQSAARFVGRTMHHDKCYLSHGG